MTLPRLPLYDSGSALNAMDQEIFELAQRLLRTGADELTARERSILTRIARRLHVTQNVNEVFDEQLSFGERLSDRISAFGGSWPFIILFGSVLVVWIILNTVVLTHRAFDPSPFILLNLVLSMLAAIQAPVIMMSQNRQASKDRLAAAHDYEVNLKSELEIMRIHDKLDDVVHKHLVALHEHQDKQWQLLSQIAGQRDRDGHSV